ncbi:MAG: His/Gly/Thr/Pro-type tRNA ligase C-terminal domain-containing protein, partial [Gammaproteobacteria bacterium]|nr:His/Gly/Thr/Pro-type tRNA ligase C-terminal domain-containing protein [Gammaproteobacteria bacterium]
GEDSLWDKAEQALMQALRQTGLEHTIEEGEGAFYGPKIDFSMRDSIGRVWQLGTIQLDFSMPARLGATYVAEDSSRRVPVMLHRAILGSLERFIGVLIEHFAGSLPPWLAPVQAVVLNITDRQSAYAAELAESLKKQGFQVGIDLRNEKIGFKIREHSIQRVPYLLVVGHLEEEDADQNVAVRSRDHGDLGVMSIDKFARRLREDCARRGRISLEE